MGGFIEPSPVSQQRDSNWAPIVIGIAAVVIAIGILAWLSRGQPKNATNPHPYAANIKLGELKMSAAENFVGASVTYLDGIVANTGDKTVTQAMVHLTFKNSLGEVAQIED